MMYRKIVYIRSKLYTFAIHQKNKIMYIALGIIALFVIIVIFMNNSLIVRKNAVNNAFSSIDVMLQKRYDLIPNLVQTVKAYSKYEQETLTKITELRTTAMSPSATMDEKIKTENELQKSMGKLMVAVENYPDLKANQNYLQLQGSWNELEEQLSASRRAFNAAINDYNNAVETFPTNLIANMKHYQTKAFFEVPEEKKQMPIMNL